MAAVRRPDGVSGPDAAGYDPVERDGEDAVLRLRGELASGLQTDLLNHVLEAQYGDQGVHLIRVDVSPVTFMDRFGVATLVGLLREAQRRGKRFQVEGARGQVRAKLKVTGVLRILEQS